ncbi:hypothetical protein IEO21_04338 [Rhodonia placenta]|uniref:Protein ARV n=1 Tax=Rhodonia placenta TaxID=104341 RepID=A0A8H7P3Z5_9APHY|nr:hypothetical protein IEO21_04338 [Postia placenta]
MPICTSCTHPTPFLYTVYQSAHNTRLEQCTACHAFADPYVEHDTLTLLLDLILLKRDVYRHLLFNRGLGARKAGRVGLVNPVTNAQEAQHGTNSSTNQANARRWYLIVRLGAALITVDACALSPGWFVLPDGGNRNWESESLECFVRILAGCVVETVAFHAGIMIACYTILTLLAWNHRSRRKTTADVQVSGIRREFRYSHVPLTLLYSSLTKLFLLFLLSIWRPAPSAAPVGIDATSIHPIAVSILRVFDEDQLDREWIVRNVLGGMAAGFGLRVVLDCHPVFTTAIILVGWAIKTAVAGLVSGWVGLVTHGDYDTPGEIWLAYSIP